MQRLPIEFDGATVAAVFRHLPSAVVAADTERRITYMNPAAEELFGYRKEDLLGKRTYLLYALASDFERQGRSHYNASVSGVEGFRVAYRRRDGVTFLGETSGGPMRNAAGELQGYIGIIRVAAEAAKSVTVLQRLHAITADATLTLSDRTNAILSLGSEHFGLPLAIQSRVVGDAYTVEHCRDPNGALQPGTEFALRGTYCVHTLGAGEATGFHHAGTSEIREHPCYVDFGLEAYLGCPIEVDGEIHGTLNFSGPECCDPFTPDDFALVRLFADWVGQAIAGQRRREELERLAGTDTLTGLPNRRTVLKELEWQMAHAERSALPLAVVLCDLDHFKRVNDEYGHRGGDLVLQAFAEVAVDVGRSIDRIGRVGGEEFLFVLPGTGRVGALAFGERLIAALNERAVKVIETDSVRIGASLGAALARPAESLERLLARADRAMYDAKENGRNRLREAS